AAPAGDPAAARAATGADDGEPVSSDHIGPSAGARPNGPAPAPPPAARPAEARWAIMAIGGIPQKNAGDVAKFLEEKGFKTVSVVGSGENFGVVVGAYVERKGDPFDQDLKSIRGLAYKDGKRAFAGAYAFPLR